MKAGASGCVHARISRRLILRSCMASAIAAAGIPNIAAAMTSSDGNTRLELLDLIKTLNATEKDVCVSAASRLDALDSVASEFDLHLRHANLDEGDATKIAVAIRNLSPTHAPTVRSFSISYNPGIGESGAIALINSLPTTVTEIGMVGCGLTDQSGIALLAWAERAVSLRMLCVEDNNYSAEMRQRIAGLREVRNGLFVVV